MCLVLLQWWKQKKQKWEDCSIPLRMGSVQADVDQYIANEFAENLPDKITYRWCSVCNQR